MTVDDFPSDHWKQSRATRDTQKRSISLHLSDTVTVKMREKTLRFRYRRAVEKGRWKYVRRQVS